MNKNKKNGFTLIELIAVLVILAIIALIVTPLVMNTVKKAKDSANKRSVDAYGKSVELAVATYLLDNGDYPIDLNGLTIDYSGNEVVCNVKTLNEDGSIYLSKCSVSGRDVKDSSTDDGFYHYGKSNNTAVTSQAYNVGDVVTYNGINFYVIEDSDETSDRVTMLKAEPLTVDEVNTYGAGHTNMYVDPSSLEYQTAYDYNGYGSMAYYSSLTCGYNGTAWVSGGCTTDYDVSEVKYVVDAWANDKLNVADLTEDKIGYRARLITYDEFENLGYEWGERTPSDTGWVQTENTPSWVYNSNYSYWTMSQSEDSVFRVWRVYHDGDVSHYAVYDSTGYVVRPVITLKKSAI